MFHLAAFFINVIRFPPSLLSNGCHRGNHWCHPSY